MSPVGLTYNLAPPPPPPTKKGQYRAVPYLQRLPESAPPYHPLMDITRSVPTHIGSALLGLPIPLKLPLATTTCPWPYNGLPAAPIGWRNKGCLQVPWCACSRRWKEGGWALRLQTATPRKPAKELAHTWASHPTCEHIASKPWVGSMSTDRVGS